jgi:sec-independent protein translocase protein TatC
MHTPANSKYSVCSSKRKYTFAPSGAKRRKAEHSPYFATRENDLRSRHSPQTILNSNPIMAEQGENREMSFFDHLDDLRVRIMWALAGLIVGCIISGVFINQIMDAILLAPATNVGMKLQNLRPFGQAFLYFKVVFATGIIIASPWILWNLWKFIAPGLYENERNWARRITFYTTFCFFAGVAFAYYVMLPGMMQFSVSFGSKNIENNYDVNEYFGFVTTTLLGAGLIFELPMMTYVLARFGIVSAALMRKYRRHAFVVILIVAAVLTPSPDPVNQLTFAAPLFVLYEISIIVARVARKKERKPANA